MDKTITLRVSESDYKQIVKFAKAQRRPISNYIVHAVFNTIANAFSVDDKEMKKIMEGVITLDVPLVVDVSVGSNWRDVAPVGE